MTLLTEVARNLFDPTTAAGKARAPRMDEVRRWGIEIEGQLPYVGTWTPALTFAEPSGETIVLSDSTGRYVKLGDLYVVNFTITSSSFTHASSGALHITGLPATARRVVRTRLAAMQGVTKSGYTSFSVNAPAGKDYLTLAASGSGQAISEVTAADMPTGGSVILRSAAHLFMI